MVLKWVLLYCTKQYVFVCFTRYVFVGAPDPGPLCQGVWRADGDPCGEGEEDGEGEVCRRRLHHHCGGFHLCQRPSHSGTVVYCITSLDPLLQSHWASRILLLILKSQQRIGWDTNDELQWNNDLLFSSFSHFIHIHSDWFDLLF